VESVLIVLLLIGYSGGVLPKSCSLCYESPTAREGKEDFR